MDRRGPGSGKRGLPPGADQSPPTRRRTTAPQDRQVVQATRALENMSMVATSPGQGQYQSGPTPPGPAYRNVSSIQTGRGQYHSPAQPPLPPYGHGPSFQPGRNPFKSRPQSRPPPSLPMYGSVRGVQPEQLSVDEKRMLWDAVSVDPDPDFQEIKRNLFQNRYDITPEMLEEASWTGMEDLVLWDSGITLHANAEELDRVAEFLQDYKERSGDDFRLRSTDEYLTRFAYLVTTDEEDNMMDPPVGVPTPPTPVSGFPAPGTYSAIAGSASRGPDGASRWPAQYYGDPRAMPGAFLGQERQHNYAPRAGAQTLSSDPYECPDPEAYLDDGSEDYGDPCPSPGVFLDHDFSGGSIHQTRPDTSPSSPSGGPLGSQEHGGNRADHRGDALHLGHYRTLTNEILEEVKVQLAMGRSIADIHRVDLPGYSYHTLKNRLWKTGWRAWAYEENDRLRNLLNQYGDQWARICSELGGLRSEEEVEARVKFLKGPPTDAQARNIGAHEFTPEEDNYIMHGAATRTPYDEMRSRIDPKMSFNVLEKRVGRLGARWAPKDDRKLKWEVDNYHGTEVDWEFIAESFDPPRNSDVLKTRWRYLQNIPNSRGRGNKPL